MMRLDMGTLLVSYLISDAICMAILILLWRQSHQHVRGTGFWMTRLVLVFWGVLLVTLRGHIPDFLSIVGGNALFFTSHLLLYMGLERFVGKLSKQALNLIFLVMFILVHSYFTLLQPSLVARNINSSTALLFFYVQVVWLLFHRMDRSMRSETLAVGIVAVIICLGGLGRIFMLLVVGLPETDFLQEVIWYETMAILGLQMLLVAETFTLLLAVNSRLMSEVRADLAERRQAVAALRQSETNLQQRNRELGDLNAIVVSLTSSLALEDVLRSILDALPRFFPQACGASVQLLDERDGRLYTYPAPAGQTSPPQALIFSPGQGIAGWVFQERKPYYAPEITADPTYLIPPIPPEYRSLLAAPLMAQNQALGVLNITARQAHAFNELDMGLLGTLANYIAIAVQNAHLYQQIGQDAEARKMLLNEVNHRVKNNLAAILALIQMEKSQAKHTTAKPTWQALADLEERVRSIQVVHEQLSAARWEALPAENLVRQTVLAALSHTPIHKHIRLDIHTPGTENLWIKPQRVGDVALVTNELTTNSAKYAFAGRGGGRIKIELSMPQGTNDLVLIFQDDGPGWPVDILTGQQFNTGLGLIQSTVRDQMTLSNCEGACIALVFQGALEVGAGFS